jgi:NAD(P)-dependent dehydrogenase (short-subunit alcohol dehydrogenase family)
VDFVSSYLAEELIKRGANVFGLIRKRADGTKARNLVNKVIVDSIHFLEGDLTLIWLRGAIEQRIGSLFCGKKVEPDYLERLKLLWLRKI